MSTSLFLALSLGLPQASADQEVRFQDLTQDQLQKAVETYLGNPPDSAELRTLVLEPASAQEIEFDPVDEFLRWHVKSRRVLQTEAEREPMKSFVRGVLKESVQSLLSGDQIAAFEEFVENRAKTSIQIVDPTSPDTPEPPEPLDPPPMSSTTAASSCPEACCGTVVLRRRTGCKLKRRPAYVCCNCCNFHPGPVVSPNVKTIGESASTSPAESREIASSRVTAERIAAQISRLSDSVDPHSSFVSTTKRVPEPNTVSLSITNQFYGQGFHQFWQGQYADSLRSLSLAVKYSPQDARAWTYKGLAELRLGDEAAGIDSLARAIVAERSGATQSHKLRAALERVQGDLRIQLENARILAVAALSRQARTSLAVN